MTLEVDTNKRTVSNIELGTPTTSDNDGIYSTTNNATDIYSLGLNTVTWITKDSSGNSASCDQRIAVIDLIDPFISCPSAVVFQTDPGKGYASTFDLGIPVSSDNDALQSVSNNAPSTLNFGTFVVTWIATDVSKNSSHCFQSVTIDDLEDPIISCPKDFYKLAVPADVNGVILTLDSATATDNVKMQDITNNAPSKFEIGKTTVIWTATDIAGNQSTCNQIVDIHNDIPFFISSPETTVYEDSSYSYAISTVDSNGHILEIELTSGSSWLSIIDNGDGTATLTGKPTYITKNDTIAIVLKVSDFASSSTQVFNLVVFNVKSKPVTISDTLIDFNNEVTILACPPITNPSNADYHFEYNYLGEHVEIMDELNNSCLDLSRKTTSRFFDSVLVSTCLIEDLTVCDTAYIILNGIFNGFEIMEGISPNNDGLNDIWKIFGIENFGENQVEIYTRWGELIYKTNNYNNEDNSWNGTMNKGSGKGKKALEGVYYYILQVEDKIYKGTITVN